MSEDLGVFRAISFQALIHEMKALKIRKGVKFTIFDLDKKNVSFICTRKRKVDKHYCKVEAERVFDA